MNRTASMMSGEKLAKHIPPRPPKLPQAPAAAAPEPVQYEAWTSTHEPRVWLSIVGAPNTTSVSTPVVRDKQLMHEIAHALNCHAPLRAALAYAGEILVDANVPAGHPVFAAIDKVLSESRA